MLFKSCFPMNCMYDINIVSSTLFLNIIEYFFNTLISYLKFWPMTVMLSSLNNSEIASITSFQRKVYIISAVVTYWTIKALILIIAYTKSYQLSFIEIERCGFSIKSKETFLFACLYNLFKLVYIFYNLIILLYFFFSLP